MNAQDLYAGEYYAYLPNRGRGVQFSPYCYKVMVRRVVKEMDSYARERATTYVYVTILTDDEQREIEPRETKIRARDILNFWDEYEDELEAWQRREEERDREAQNRLTAENDFKQEVRQAVLDAGIPEEWIASVTTGGVLLSNARIAIDKGIETIESRIRSKEGLDLGRLFSE